LVCLPVGGYKTKLQYLYLQHQKGTSCS